LFRLESLLFEEVGFLSSAKLLNLRGRICLDNWEQERAPAPDMDEIALLDVS
jgi:hypothetical protein